MGRKSFKNGGRRKNIKRNLKTNKGINKKGRRRNVKNYLRRGIKKIRVRSFKN